MKNGKRRGWIGVSLEIVEVEFKTECAEEEMTEAGGEEEGGRVLIAPTAL